MPVQGTEKRSWTKDTAGNRWKLPSAGMRRRAESQNLPWRPRHQVPPKLPQKLRQTTRRHIPEDSLSWEISGSHRDNPQTVSSSEMRRCVTEWVVTEVSRTVGASIFRVDNHHCYFRDNLISRTGDIFNCFPII